MSHHRVAIVAGTRTPFVKAGKALASAGPSALAKHAVRGLLDRHNVDPEGIDAIAFGAVVPERGKPNLAREIVFEAGLPARIEAQTVSSYCITGLRTATIIPAVRGRGGPAPGGNWSADPDGASAVLLMSEQRAGQEGRAPLAFIEAMEYAALHPREGLLMAPAIAVPSLLGRVGLQLADIDLIEIHEAFAAQVLANAAAWEQGWKGPATDPVNWDRVNVNGSSIALCHPGSATGGRVLTTLAYEMARRNARDGPISMWSAGPMAGAFLLTRE